MVLIATLTMNPALDIATSTPELRPTDKLRCTAPRYDPGGGGINVARVIHALGGESVALFPAGGPAGGLLERLLAQQGVTHVALPIAGQTRESFTVDEDSTSRQYRFVLPGPELAAAEQQAMLDALAALPSPPAYVVVSGSLPPGMTPAFYAQVGAAARAAGARFVLDSSGAALCRAGRTGAWLVKPNLRELEECVGRPLREEPDIVAGARAQIADGLAEVLVVSLGARGALLVTAEEDARFRAPEVKAVSTVGAGDSMLAGVILAHSRGSAMRNAVRYGIACGAAALLARGTQLAHAADVERLHAELLRQDG